MGVGVLGLRIVGGAMKEGKGGNVEIDREEFSEEIGGVDEAGEKDKAEKVLAHPLLQPVEMHGLSTWTSSGEPKKSQDR